MRHVYGSSFLAAKLSRRAALRAGAGLAAATAAALRSPAPGHAQSSGTLNLFTWEGYAPKELVAKFEKETGIKTAVTYYASNGELISKLKATRATGYDLVQPSVTLIPAAMDDDLYQPIDPGKVKNAGNLVPSMLKASEELGGLLKGQRYGLPFDWGTEGVSYNTARVAKRPDSFGVIHDPAHAGKIAYRATFHVFVSTGLHLGLGNRMRDIYVSREKATPILDRVLAKLVESKKLVKTYWSTAQEIENLLGNEEVLVAETWDGTGWKLEKNGKPVKFVAPKEGAMTWMDGFALPKGAKNVEQAYAWISFMYDPRNAAAFTNDSRYGTAVQGADQFLEPSFRKQYNESFSRQDIDNLWWYGIEHSWWLDMFSGYVDRLKAA